MSDLSRLAIWRRFLALPNDSWTKTLGVAFLVALASASIVSVTSVALRPRVQANLEAAREARLVTMIETLPGLADILRETGAETLDTVVVDLASGRITEVEPNGFDFLGAQSDPAQSISLTAEQDIAGIGRRPNQAPAHLLRGRDGLALVVFPVYGQGYQSTIRAYLALAADLRTIAGLSIYEQEETPGLGSRITDPDWLAQWGGRQAMATSGEITINVVRGGATGPSEVDGIAGATRSSMGVAHLVQFWLGPDGFGPFIANLRSGAAP